MVKRHVVTIAAIVIALIAVVGAWAWGQSMRRQLRDTEVAHANALAAKDTAIVRLTALGDSQVAVTRRLAFQAEVDLEVAEAAFGDEMDDSLEVWATSLAQFRIRGDSLERELVGRDAEVDTAGSIVAESKLDAIDSLGVSVAASVEIPPTLISPIWRWSVVRAPASVSVGLRCEGALAAAYLTSPPWLPIAVDSVVQDDAICNPLPAGWQPFKIEMPSIPVAGGLVFGGMVLQSILNLFGER